MCEGQVRRGVSDEPGFQTGRPRETGTAALFRPALKGPKRQAARQVTRRPWLPEVERLHAGGGLIATLAHSKNHLTRTKQTISLDSNRNKIAVSGKSAFEGSPSFPLGTKGLTVCFPASLHLRLQEANRHIPEVEFAATYSKHRTSLFLLVTHSVFPAPVRLLCSGRCRGTHLVLPRRAASKLTRMDGGASDLIRRTKKDQGDAHDSAC